MLPAIAPTYFYKEDIPLRKLDQALSRFCAKHPYWGIPNLMRYIVAGTVIMYVLILVTNYQAYSLLNLSFSAILRGEVWRLVTFIFVPVSLSPISLAISLYFYYWIGGILENYWGTPKFTIYYLSGIILTLLASLIAYLSGGGDYGYGMHYVNMAMFLAYAILNPEAYVYLLYLIPIKVKWLAYLDLIYFAYDVLTAIGARAWGYAAAPIVALLNFFVFFYPYFSHKARQERYRASKQATRFRQTVKASQQPKSYNHKCEVCGRTDTDYPNLSFRYCSRCTGYHCYCEDHIFNHVHHTEDP